MTSSNGRYDDNAFSYDSGWVEEVSDCTQSASKSLQAYIEQFEGEIARTPKTTRHGCYAETSVSSLLSSKPKAASPPGTLKKAGLAKTSEDMVDNLVDWVKASYTKDLHRKIVPYGSPTSSLSKTSLRLSELDETDNNDDDNKSSWSDPGVELSTLPSPGSSVASDIESMVESVSTDVLLQSFYKMGKIKLTKAQATSKNYPSWVEDLTSQYPSWIDDIDKTQVTHNQSFIASLQNQQDATSSHQASLSMGRLSRSLSPSFFRHPARPDESPPSFMSTSPHHRESVRKPRSTTRNQAWELESTDTEVLISQPIYGRQPVNMGGNLHSSLYRDKKIQQLHEESLRKTVKRNRRVPLTKEKPSAANCHAHHKKTPPSATSRDEGNSTALMHRTSISPNISPPRNKERKSLKVQRPGIEDGVVHSPGTRQEPFKTMTNLKLVLEERKRSVDSNNTDKLMRQSPTGIHMVERVGDRSASTMGRKIIKETPNGRTVFQTTRTEGKSSKETLNGPTVFETTRTNKISSKETPNGRIQRNASRELTKLLESAERRSVEPESIVGKWRGVPQTTGGRYFARTNNPRTNDPRSNDPRANEPRANDSRRNDLQRHDLQRNDLGTNDPRKIMSDVRNTPRSVPRLRTTSVPELIAHRLKQSSFSDRRIDPTISDQFRNGALRKTKPPRYYTHNRLDSGGHSYEGSDCSTNTEVLVIHPPMPLFDASPSLTTVTASSVGSDETATGLLEQEALRTSILADQSDLASSLRTSLVDLVRSPDERWKPGEPRQDWEGDHAYENGAHSFTKPGIITSFLEDCIRNSEESKLNEVASLSTSREESVSDVSERPVETLKKMLFTVQSLAQQTEDEVRSDDEIISENCDTRSETRSEEMFSDVMSNQTPNADNSLSRAYYHLARLKKLVSVSERVSAGLRS